MTQQFPTQKFDELRGLAREKTGEDEHGIALEYHFRGEQMTGVNVLLHYKGRWIFPNRKSEEEAIQTAIDMIKSGQDIMVV